MLLPCIKFRVRVKKFKVTLSPGSIRAEDPGHDKSHLRLLERWRLRSGPAPWRRKSCRWARDGWPRCWPEPSTTPRSSVPASLARRSLSLECKKSTFRCVHFGTLLETHLQLASDAHRRVSCGADHWRVSSQSGLEKEKKKGSFFRKMRLVVTDREVFCCDFSSQNGAFFLL